MPQTPQTPKTPQILSDRTSTTSNFFSGAFSGNRRATTSLNVSFPFFNSRNRWYTVLVTPILQLGSSFTAIALLHQQPCKLIVGFLYLNLMFLYSTASLALTTTTTVALTYGAAAFTARNILF